MDNPHRKDVFLTFDSLLADLSSEEIPIKRTIMYKAIHDAKIEIESLRHHIESMSKYHRHNVELEILLEKSIAMVYKWNYEQNAIRKNSDGIRLRGWGSGKDE